MGMWYVRTGEGSAISAGCDVLGQHNVDIDVVCGSEFVSALMRVNQVDEKDCEG